MSQRGGNVEYAERSYSRMLHHGYKPDVFTLTALLDVTGRKGSLKRALEIYSYMMSSIDILPNIVSFVTMIGIAGHQSDKSYGSRILNQLYSDAQSLANQGLSDSLLDVPNNRMEVSIYNSTLAACVRLPDFELARRVVKDLVHSAGCDLPLSPLTTKILAKLSLKFTSSDLYSFLSNDLSTINTDASKGITTTDILLSDGAITSLHSSSINLVVEDIQTGKYVHSSARTYTGCLGCDASPHLRESVMTHDVNKLIDRLNTNQTERERESDEENEIEERPREGSEIKRENGDSDEDSDVEREGEPERERENESNDIKQLEPTTNPSILSPSFSLSLSPSLSHSMLVENDFVTLLHQCRKRKW
eukprot:CAMPEP_0182438438 /NCGR_PEP_ID=MMETSP1167-20130531/85776_1 /TAXON_ID=2988 /ORGANISM="Mallomonas Sp, Strain CCMP3275" /LENGTH=361 /DNA_ID=CAMNT_0024631817 /DNA_START=325 /DNA_END=1407 /DNA_ORIENTATION=+